MIKFLKTNRTIGIAIATNRLTQETHTGALRFHSDEQEADFDGRSQVAKDEDPCSMDPGESKRDGSNFHDPAAIGRSRLSDAKERRSGFSAVSCAAATVMSEPMSELIRSCLP